MNLNEIPAWSDIESQPWFAELTPEEKQQSLTKWQGDMMSFAKDPKEKFAVAATSKAKARSFFGEEMPDDPIADALQRRQKDLEDIGSRYDAFSKGELEEDDEEVLTLNDTLKGNTPYSVIKGRLFVSPQLVWDKAAYEKVVNEAPVDEDERVLAMSAYDGSKERAAEGVVNSLGYTDEAFRDFAAKGFKEGKSNAAILDEWKANNKLPDGILGSLRGVGRQAYFGLRSGLSGLERAMGGLGGFFGSESAQKYAEESGKEAQSYMQRTLGEGPEFIGELTSGAVSIIPTIAAGAAASVISEGAALPAAASITAGAIQSAGATQAETYEFYRNQGLDHANALAESRVDGLVSGLITGAITHYAGKLGDKIGLGKGIEGLFSGPASKIASKLTQREISESLKAGAKAVGGSFLQEGSEELLDQAAQDAYSMIKRDPTLTLAEAINNALQAGKVGAVLGGAAEAGKIGLKSLLDSAKFSVAETPLEKELQSFFEIKRTAADAVVGNPNVQGYVNALGTAKSVVDENLAANNRLTADVLDEQINEDAENLKENIETDVTKVADNIAPLVNEAPPVVEEAPAEAPTISPKPPVSPASETAPISETPAVTTAPLAPIPTEETQPPQGKPVETPTNALPIRPTTPSLPREERPEMGLQQVGEGNAQPEKVAETGQAGEEVAPREGFYDLETRTNFAKLPASVRGDRFVLSPVTGLVFDRMYAQSVTPPAFTRPEQAVRSLNESRYNADVSLPVSLGRSADGADIFTSAADLPPVVIPQQTPSPPTTGAVLTETLPDGQEVTPGGVASPSVEAAPEPAPEAQPEQPSVKVPTEGEKFFYQIRAAQGRPATDAEGVPTGWKLNEFRDAIELVSEDASKYVVFPIENPSSYGDKLRALITAEIWAIDNPIRAQLEAAPMEANYGAGRVEDVTPKTVKFVHTTKTTPGKGQKSGYYPGTYAYESESGLLPSMEGNKFVGELPESGIYTLKDADQLKKDAADAGFGKHSGNGNAEVKYLQSLGFKAMRRPAMGGTEIIVFDAKDANFQPASAQADLGAGAATRAEQAPIESPTAPLAGTPASPQVQAFRDAVSQMTPTAQAKWTPELRATAEAYLDSGGTTGLQGLSDVQQKVVGRFLPEEVKAAFDAEDARKRAQRNKLPDHRESSLPPTPGKQIRKIGKGAMESVPVVLDEIAKVIPNIRELVEVRESVEGEPDAEGFYDPQADKAVVLVDNVYLKPQHGGSQEAALRETIIHELLHRGFAKLRQTNPQLFEQFEAYSLADTNDAQFEALVRRGYSMYSNWKDDPAQNQKAREEIFIRKAVVDLNFKGIEAIKSPSSLASQFFSWLRGLLNKLLGRKVDDETLLHWSRVFLNAAQADFIEKTPGERMHAFAGEKAIENLPEERRQFMRDSLETAKAMAAAGKDSEEIRAVTGWFPGKYDGKMRWELPDEGTSLRLAEYREARKNGDSPQDIVRKFFSDRQAKQQEEALLAVKGMPKDELLKFSREFTDKKKKENASLYEFFAKGDNTDKGRVPLGYLLDHPALFEGYPETQWTPISFNAEDVGFDAAGQVNPDGSIGLNPAVAFSDEASALSTLLHESQHLIQKKEGFAKGSSTAQAAKRQGWDGYYDEAQAMRDYERAAGEIEARDVQARQNFTPEQRKATAPYSSENIAKEDAIVMFGGGGDQRMFSLSPPTPDMQAEADALREVTPNSQALDKFRETFGTPRQDVGQVLGKKEGSVYTQAQVAPLIEYARSMIGFENDANGDPIINPEATQKALNMVANLNGRPGFASQFNVRAAEVFKGKPVDPEIATAVLVQELQAYANRLSASSPKAEDQILKAALTPFYNTIILGNYLTLRTAGRALQAAGRVSGTDDARKSREEAEKAVNKEITKQLGDEALPAAEGMDKAGVEGGVDAIKDDLPAPADPTLRLLDLAVESLDGVAKADANAVFDVLLRLGEAEEALERAEKVGNKAMSILTERRTAQELPSTVAELKVLVGKLRVEAAEKLAKLRSSLEGAKPETKKKVKEKAAKAGGKKKATPKVSDKEEDPITEEINALAAELGTLSKLDQAGLDVVKQIAKKLVAKFQPAKLDALKDKVEAVVYKYVQNAERLELAEFSENMTADLDAIGLKKPELQEALVAKAWAYHFAAPTKAVQALTAKMKSAERADRGGPESVANVRKAVNGAVNSTEENRDAFVTRLTDQLVALGVEPQSAEAAAKAAFEYRARQADKKIERVMETLRLGKRRALLKSFQNTKEADRTEEWQRATLKAAFVEAGLTNKQAERGADKAMQEAEAIFATAGMKVAEIKQRGVQKFLDSLASVEDETPVTKTKQDNLRSVFKDATLDEEFNEAVLMDRFQTLGATEAQAKALVEKVAEVREDKAEALAEAKRKQVNKVIDATYKRIAQLESGTPSEKAKKQESLRNAVGAAIKAKEFDEAAFRTSVVSFGASDPQVETLVQNVKKLRQLGESKPLSKAKLRQFLLSFPKNVLANPEQREALLRSFLKGQNYSEAEINRIVPQVLRDFDTGYQKARKAYLDELEKKLKPKQGQKESKQDQQNRKMLNALRSGLADTTSETSVALAKSLGFEAFRPQDDHILSKLDEEMRKLREQDRISDANAKFVQIRDLLNRRRPPRDFMQVAAQGWITSALSSLSNFAVNVWAPLGEAGVRFTSDILRAASTGRIDEIPLYLEAAIQALKSMPPRAKFAFKTDTFTNSVNTLIADMASMKDELQRALNTYRSKDSSKLAKAAAAGRILFTIGDLSRRVLSTVDDTWYTALSSYIGSSNLIKDLRDAKLPKAAVQAIAFHANNDALHQAQAEHATLDAVSQFVESLRGKTEEEIDAGLEYLGLNDASVTQAQADYIQEIVSALQSLRIRSGATGDDLVKRALKEISNFKAAVNVRAVELGQARTKELLATALTEVGQTPQQIEEAQRNYDENAKKAASFGMGLHRVEGVPSYDIMGKAVQIVDAMGRGAVTTSPLLGRMMVGFFGIPLNLLNKSLWFTPYGLGRYFLAKWQMAKNPEEKFYEYSMSSQREMSQRVNEIIIGHTIMAAAFALGAIRDQEDEEGEGLYITLGGPSNKTEYDAWYARGFRKFSFCYKTKAGSVAAVPYGRGMGEVLKMPLMLLGAFDDMRLNKKLGDREDMSSIIEYLNSAAAGIGNQATFLGAKNTVGAFAPDKIGANTASSIAYAVSNLVPFNGLDRSIAALAVGPPDRSRTGAILANIPIARWLATDPAINVFGDKWGNKSDANFAVLWDRQWNQGLIPLNISAPLTGQDKRLYGFIGERLIGPSPALRGALELRNGYVTDKQWYDYSIYRGRALKREMVTQLDRLRRMDDDSLSKAIAELSTKATKKAKDRFNYK